MPDRKYMYHSAGDFTGVRTNRNIKDVMEGSIGSRADTMKQYKKSEKTMEEIPENSQEAEQDSI